MASTEPRNGGAGVSDLALPPPPPAISNAAACQGGCTDRRDGLLQQVVSMESDAAAPLAGVPAVAAPLAIPAPTESRPRPAAKATSAARGSGKPPGPRAAPLLLRTPEVAMRERDLAQCSTRRGSSHRGGAAGGGISTRRASPSRSATAASGDKRCAMV